MSPHIFCWNKRKREIFRCERSRSLSRPSLRPVVAVAAGCCFLNGKRVWRVWKDLCLVPTHTIYVMDNRELTRLPSESVHLTVTSPPYVTTEFKRGQEFDYEGFPTPAVLFIVPQKSNATRPTNGRPLWGQAPERCCIINLSINKRETPPRRGPATRPMQYSAWSNLPSWHAAHRSSPAASRRS
jgi:hypothetical protein